MVEGKIAEVSVEDLREGCRDKFVDQTTRHHETRLPGAVNYLVEHILEKLLAGQDIPDVELHVSNSLHVHLSAYLLAWQFGHGGRLYQIVCNVEGDRLLQTKDDEYSLLNDFPTAHNRLVIFCNLFESMRSIIDSN